MRRKIIRVLATILGLLLLVVAVVGVPFAMGRPWTLEQFYVRTAAGYLLRSPMALTDTGVLRGAGLRWYEDEIDAHDFVQLQELAEFVRERRETLHGYDPPEDFEARISYEAADWWLERLGQYTGPWVMHTYTFDHLLGAHAGLHRFLTGKHKLEDADDARAYVARAGQLKRALEQVEDRGMRKVEAGFVPPNFILEQVANDARKFAGYPPDQHPLVTRFDDGLAQIDELDAQERDALRAQLVLVVTEEIGPAWTAFAERIEKLAATASSDAGVWRLDDGDQFYLDCLRFFIGRDDVDPEKLHRLGLAEAKRLEEEQWKILEELGIERGPNIGDALRALNARQTERFDRTPEGIARATKVLQAHVDDATGPFEDVFDLRPHNRVVVKPVPEHLWDSRPPAYYEPGPMDGSEPGTVFFNAKFIPEAPVRAGRSLMAHEAIPGHHYQIWVNRQQEVPLFRKLFNISGVTEGWGLYAETLADERGFYRTPEDRLGYLEQLAFRAHRLVVDTGIHHKRWTREQAITHLEQNTAFSREVITMEVDRYVVLPGQAASYYTGLLELLRLRAKAKQALGEGFEIVDFHHVVLTSAQVPWPLIERRIDRWIETGKPL